jgi:aspartate-semialdehyde dehydrogenase
LLGGETLAGKELREAIEERKLPVTLTVFSSQAGAAALTASGEDEASVLPPFSAAAITGAQVVFLAGDAAQSRAAMAQAREAGVKPVWVDLHGVFEDMPESRVRAPLVEAQTPDAAAAPVQTPAHPGAVLLARFLALLHPRFPLRRAVATVFEPASAHGRKGMDELHQQTVSLFNFQNPPQAVFDAQAAFNLLPRYGNEAPEPLAGSEARMERHLATLLAPLGAPLPSIKLIHAPVFHGYCLSVWVEYAVRPAVADAEAVFREAGIDVRSAAQEPPSNRAVAGQSGFIVGAIEDDRNDARAAWFFLAADNLRTLADNAVMIAALCGGAE